MVVWGQAERKSAEFETNRILWSALCQEWITISGERLLWQTPFLLSSLLSCSRCFCVVVFLCSAFVTIRKKFDYAWIKTNESRLTSSPQMFLSPFKRNNNRYRLPIRYCVRCSFIHSYAFHPSASNCALYSLVYTMSTEPSSTYDMDLVPSSPLRVTGLEVTLYDKNSVQHVRHRLPYSN